MTNTGTSAFVKMLNSNKAVIRQLRQERAQRVTRGDAKRLDDAEICKLFDLSAKDRMTVEAKLISAKIDTHPADHKLAGGVYASFTFIFSHSTEGEIMYSVYIGMYDRQSPKDFDPKGYNRFAGFMEKLGYPDGEYSPQELAAKVEELKETKPKVKLLFLCNATMAGQLRLNCFVDSLVSSESPKKAPTAAPEPEEVSEVVQPPEAATGASSKVVVKEGDKVLFTFEDGDDSEEVTATVIRLDGDKVDLDDGRYEYKEIPVARVAKV
jgi:hypothetical protein